MTGKSIGLLSAAVACATIMGVTISSCDGNSNPATPGGNGLNNGGKNPQVLDGPCLGTVAVSDCPTGEAIARYNEDGELVVTNLNGQEANGINCSFASPINVWNANIRAIFPSSGNGALNYTAQDNQGNVEARLDVRQQGNEIHINPTFTSPPDGGKSYYDVAIYDAEGNLQAAQQKIDLSTPVKVIPDCSVNLIQSVGWSVYQVNSQCLWKILTNPCCNVRWILPNGTVANGSKITLRERNEEGLYVYLETKNIYCCCIRVGDPYRRLRRRITNTGPMGPIRDVTECTGGAVAGASA